MIQTALRMKGSSTPAEHVLEVRPSHKLVRDRDIFVASASHAARPHVWRRKQVKRRRREDGVPRGPEGKREGFCPCDPRHGGEMEAGSKGVRSDGGGRQLSPFPGSAFLHFSDLGTVLLQAQGFILSFIQRLGLLPVPFSQFFSRAP